MRHLILLSVVALVSCTHALAEPEVKNFYEGDPSTRIERFEKMPIDLQYKIFVYGNQRVHPPIRSLGKPLAKHGKLAFDYIAAQIEQSENDLDYRDSMTVFEFMQRGGYYDICGDDMAVSIVRENQHRIRNADWKTVYQERLRRLCS
jgi:hypothetical protein